VSVAANGDPQKNPQKTPQKIMEAMRANPSITRNELAELIGMTPEGVKSAISSLKASGAIRRVGPDKGGHWEVVG
jgi:ATP-dependent DNA helicase RecG